MPKSSTSTSHDHLQTDGQVDPIISKLAGLVDDLDNALSDGLERPDSREIIQGIAAAICIEELTRMTVTRIKMDAGIRSAIDAERVRSDWQVLCRHYAGGQHARILDHGVTQLAKLSSEQAQEVIYAIRRSIEPSLNWALEEKVIAVSLGLPFVGKLGIGKLRFNLRGTRVAMRSLGGRLVRLGVQGILWLAVAAGTLHWMSWTFFDEPYIASTFDSLAKLTQLILLMSSTLVVSALAARRDDPTARRGRLFRFMRIAVWGIVAAGWCHFLIWFLLGISGEASGLEPAAKLLLPFFLVSGGIAAWVFGRLFLGDGKGDE